MGRGYLKRLLEELIQNNQPFVLISFLVKKSMLSKSKTVLKCKTSTKLSCLEKICLFDLEKLPYEMLQVHRKPKLLETENKSLTALKYSVLPSRVANLNECRIYLRLLGCSVVSYKILPKVTLQLCCI